MAAALRDIGLYAKERIPSNVSGPAPVQHTSLASASSVRAAPARQKQDWLAWLIGAATLLILFLIVALGLLFMVWRFARPVILASEIKLPPAEGMVPIGDGVYLVGRDGPGDEYAVPHQVELKQFWIDQFEVTNASYAKFVAETGQKPPTGWPDGKLPAGQETYPVIGVTWDQAAAYCQWTHKRLPTEAEWEVAARGPQGLLYPWGNDEHAVVLPQGGTYPVGSISSNHSPFGAFDMAGNVWEWIGEPYRLSSRRFLPCRSERTQPECDRVPGAEFWQFYRQDRCTGGSYRHG